jgi:hypothetical protein
MAQNPETVIANLILKELPKKFPGIWIHKNVVGRAKLGSGFYSTVGLGVSSPDIVCCVKGRFVGLEVKVQGKDATDEQKAWGRQFRISGGVYEVVRCLLDCVKIIDGLDSGTYTPSSL